MPNPTAFNLLCLLLSHSIVSAQGERKDIHHMMYETFPNTAMCFRILNGTNQFGCSTPPSGSTGVVHLVNTKADITWLLENSNAGPYMAVIPPDLFVKETMEKLASSERVSGVLLALRDPVSRPDHMSPDSPCPNRYSSLPDSCDDTSPWNPLGTSFLLHDWPVPLFVVKDASVLDQITQCYKKFNEPLESQASRSLCSLQMTGHMYAAVDTPTCMRRNNLVSSFSHTSYCDPMGDQNLLSLQFPQQLYSNDSKVVLVTARLDAAGMFDGLAPGAISTISALVTLLTTAQLLTQALPQYKESYTKNIMFALVNGEAQDYIGSSRIVYDMQKGEFPSTQLPLGLDRIDQIIDLNQMDSSSKLHIHCFPNTVSQRTVETLMRASQSFGVSVDGSCSSSMSTDSKLPPSSLHSFLKAKPTLPGIILTNHKTQYTNKYYSGLLDDTENAGFKFANGSGVSAASIQISLANIAQTLAFTLAQVVDPSVKWPATIITSETAALVDKLLHCYLETRQCSMFKEVAGGVVMGDGPFPLYVGVHRSPNPVTRLTLLTLAQLTGKSTNLTLAQCNNLPAPGKDVSFSYIWVGGEETGECMQTTIDATDAVSPAFSITDYDWKSGNYSTWSESVWPELSLRMFLRPSANQELTTLITGLIVLILSFVVVYWLNRNASILFTPLPCENC